ncbi:MAG: hypothetical protein ACI35T_04145 [Alistipes sp.]
MKIQSNIPQICALRWRVEERFGKPLIVHADFVALVAVIEMEQRQHISETTLERVWNYSTRGYDTISLRTLDVLAQYGAGCYWQEFCRRLEEECESTLFNVEKVVASDLVAGDRLRIGWLPDRMCEVRYLGDNRFVAERCENSKMHKGDTFSCLQFLLGEEAVLSDFRQSQSTLSQTYIIGQRHGLTVLAIMDADA